MVHYAWVRHPSAEGTCKLKVRRVSRGLRHCSKPSTLRRIKSKGKFIEVELNEAFPAIAVVL